MRTHVGRETNTSTKSVRAAVIASLPASGLALFGLALAPVCASAQQAVADSSTDGLILQEIIVTAQKREERLQDVPVPVTAVTADTMLELNQTKAEDFFSSIPGVNLQTQYGRSQLAIRGITTGPASGNPVVGFTIDDVPFGSSTGNGGLYGAAPDIDPSELGHIEVLRGPQGTLYGAASIGGLVKYVLTDPSTEEVSGVVGAGTQTIKDSSSLDYNVRGAINIPLNDTFAIRASASTRSESGYIDNMRTGERDVNESEVIGGRLAALWRPSDALSIKFNALYQDRDVFGSGTEDVRLGRSKQSDWPDTGRVSTKNELYSLVVNADLGNDIELTSVSGYGRNDNYDITDFSAAGIKGLWAFVFDPNNDPSIVNWGTILRQDYSVDKVSQEVRLAMPIGSRVDWLIGGFYTHESAEYGIRTTAFDQDTGRVYTQADFWPAGEPAPTGQASAYALPVVWDDDVKFTEYAAFTNVTVRFTDRFDAQVGARFSKNKQEMEHREYTAFAPFGDFRSPDEDGDAFTYQVTPRFKFSDDHMFYTRLATGYRTGGPNPSCGDVPCSYEPDKTTNIEVGAKGNFFDGSASYDVSVYDIKWKDIQLVEVDGSGTFTFIDNGGEASSRGIEASFELAPSEGLVLSLWGTYMDATVKDAFPTSNIFVQDGDRLPFSSRVSGRFSASQEFSLSAGMTAHVGGSVTHVGDRLGEFVGTEDQVSLRQKYPAYSQVDLNSGVRFDDWKVNFFVQNVLDKKGINGGGFYNQSNWNQSWFNYIRPRTIGLSMERTF
jgi:iron complex outermembrane recepter protein